LDPISDEKHTKARLSKRVGPFLFLRSINIDGQSEPKVDSWRYRTVQF